MYHSIIVILNQRTAKLFCENTINKKKELEACNLSIWQGLQLIKMTHCRNLRNIKSETMKEKLFC